MKGTVSLKRLEKQLKHLRRVLGPEIHTFKKGSPKDAIRLVKHLRREENRAAYQIIKLKNKENLENKYVAGCDPITKNNNSKILIIKKYGKE